MNPSVSPQSKRNCLWLFTPVLEVLTFNTIAVWIGRIFFRHLFYLGLSVLFLNLVFAFFLCFWLGFWWVGAHGSEDGKKVAHGMLMGLGLAVVNAGAAYAVDVALSSLP